MSQLATHQCLTKRVPFNLELIIMRGEREGERGSERAISRYSQLAASLSTSFALFFRRSLALPSSASFDLPNLSWRGLGLELPTSQSANMSFPPADACAYLDSVTCAICSQCCALIWFILFDFVDFLLTLLFSGWRKVSTFSMGVFLTHLFGIFILIETRASFYCASLLLLPCIHVV